ncbi:MAG TPA: hypothetical protein VHP38_02895 [Ruminiclostridium sp.]|nr:hypothetical protein [Ruminiclostridium sp.]
MYAFFLGNLLTEAAPIAITAYSHILLPKMDGNFFYGVAKSLDVFSIWEYAVIAIGAASVSKLPKKKAYIIVAAIYVVLMIYSGVVETRMTGLI